MRDWLIQKRGNQSQEVTAKNIGISRGAYANIELGKRNPSVPLAKKIAEYLDFDWTLFFDDDVVDSKRNMHTA